MTIPLSNLTVEASALSFLLPPWTVLRPQVSLVCLAAAQVGVAAVGVIPKEVVSCQKEGPHSLHPHGYSPVSTEMDLIVAVMHHAPKEMNWVSLVMRPVVKETGTLTSSQQSKERGKEGVDFDLCDLVLRRGVGTVAVVVGIGE